MIIKANSRTDGADLARYLLIESEHQKTFLLDYRGSVADNLRDMLTYWETEAIATTRGKKPLYHVQMRLAPGETIEKKQWLQILDVLEKKLKLTDNPRAVVAHNLNGEAHLHVVYSRLDSERGVLRNMGNDRKSHHATARQMEKEFGLRQLDSTPRRDRNGNEKTRSIEHKMAKEAGTSRKALCALVKAAWEASNTGYEFQQQLARLGITMTLGERRDYNVWHSGKRYNPVRLIENVRTPEFREKMQNDPPRINERGISGISETDPVKRNAENRTREQIARDLPNETPDTRRIRDLNERMKRQIESNDDLNRRRAENVPQDQANRQIANDDVKPTRQRRSRARAQKPPAPRLRPKMFYGDPGI